MNWLLWTGGAAVVGIAVSAWTHIRAVLDQVWSRMFTSFDLHGPLANPMLVYLDRTYRRTPYGIRAFLGYFVHLRSKQAVELIAVETVSEGFRIYWEGWKPIITKRISATNASTDMVARTDRPLRVSFIRGCFSVEKMVLASTAEYQALHSKLCVGSRYTCRVISGTGDQAIVSRDSSELTAGPNHNNIGIELRDLLFLGTPLNYSFDSLREVVHSNPLQKLALNDAAQHFVELTKTWIESSEYYREHGIPWRMGALLHGLPGTGKTATVNALAQELQIPIYLFDLATLRNSELRQGWNRMLADVPCIALIEDIDATFHGRENVSKSPLTFDAILNIVDGVASVPGVIFIVTTNHIEQVDPALRNRPNRIDHVIKMTPPTYDGYVSIASRILMPGHNLEDIAKLAIDAASQEMTGAEFQLICTNLALQKLQK